MQGCGVSEGRKVPERSNAPVTGGPVCVLDPKRSLLHSLESGIAVAPLLSLVLPPAPSQSCAGHSVLLQEGWLGLRSTPESVPSPCWVPSIQPEEKSFTAVVHLGKFSLSVLHYQYCPSSKNSNGAGFSLAYSEPQGSCLLPRVGGK